MMKLSSLKNSKAFKIIGTFLMAASIAYIGYTIWKSRAALVASISVKSVVVAVVLMLLVSGMLVVFSICYRKLLTALSGFDPGRYCVELYIRSTLYKYLPGNIMHFVGRNALIREGEISFAHVNTASLLELLINLLSAFFVATVFSGGLLFEFMMEHFDYRWAIGLVIIAIVVIIGFIVLFRKRLSTIFRGILNKKVISILIVMWLVFTGWNILGNSMLFFLLKAFGCKLTERAYRGVIGAATGAWFVGFITPGAPGGIGVREAAMNFLLSGAAPSWALAAAGVLTRVAQILGELLANAGLLLVIWRKKLTARAKENHDESPI